MRKRNDAKRKIRKRNKAKRKMWEAYSKFSLKIAKQKRNKSRFTSFHFEGNKILSETGAPYLHRAEKGILVYVY
jgi:hypothetical protein